MNVSTIAGIVVGAVLLVSGALKLAAGPGWRAQARELGAPTVVVPVVPWLEIVLGALLVAQVVPIVTGIVTAVLLAAFTVLLVVRLSQGRRPPCACFGRLSARPVGPGSVVRNLVLIGLALLAAFG